MDQQPPEAVQNASHDQPAFRLGCPVWANEAWVGELYTSNKRTRWLPEYSQVFQTVEGNSTFYGLPALDTVRRWAEETEEGFHFTLKFPRDVTHEGSIDRRQMAAGQFLEVLQVLAEADRLGPAMLQLPPHFSGQRLGELERLLKWLPKTYHYAVEVRHEDFFDAVAFERELDALLEQEGVDRIHLDSRPLFSAAPSDESEQRTQERKPHMPFRKTVTASRPILRLIGRNDLDQTQPWIDEWVKIVAGWITIGLHPYVYTHTPDDAFAPQMAERFYLRLSERVMLPDLAEWPGRAAPKPPRQRTLF